MLKNNQTLNPIYHANVYVFDGTPRQKNFEYPAVETPDDRYENMTKCPQPEGLECLEEMDANEIVSASLVNHIKSRSRSSTWDISPSSYERRPARKPKVKK